MTVSELLTRTSSRELSEWIAYYMIEPFGNFREDWRAAMIATVIANSARSKKQKPFKIKDFMFAPPRAREQTIEEQLAIVREITKAFEKIECEKDHKWLQQR